jgi:hypothetical protein
MLVASRTDVKVRSALNRAYNPLFSGFYDKVSTEVFKKLKTSRTKKVTGNTDEERQKSVKEAASGEKSPEGGDRVKVDDDGNKYILDENGEKIPASDPRFDELNNKVNEVDARIKSRPKIAGKALTLANQAKKITVSDIKTTGKTSEIAKFFADQKFHKDAKVLIVVDEKTPALMRATNNLEHALLVRANYLNVYYILNADNIVISPAAVKAVEAWLGGGAK